MSLKPKRYETNQAKAMRVLIVCGKAPLVLDRMTDSTIAALAALCDANGQCVPDVQERARVILFNHYESFKAVDAELE